MSDTDAAQQQDAAPDEGQQPEAQGNDTQGQDNNAESPKFTQADVDKLVAKVRAEERRKASERANQTAEERIAALEQQLAETAREALKRRVQAAHGISDEDADLFLTGTDEETLTAQAKRLAERDSERKRTGNLVPIEGRNPRTRADDERTAVRQLFGSS